MKFLNIAAVAASVLSTGGLVAALPLRTVIVTPNDFEIAVLGGLTFRAKQSLNPNFISVGRGPRAMAGAFNKYGVTIPPDLLALVLEILQELGLLNPNGRQGGNRGGLGGGVGGGNRGNSTRGPNNNQTAAGQGEVAALPQMFDTQYLAEVQIGTPPQTLNLNFDTGSSDLWVFSSETPRVQQRGQKLYNIAQSSTAKKLDGETWSIRYGDGSGSSGNVYTDTVSIGGITVQNQAVESATMVSASFGNDTASSGLVGLGMDRINQVKPTPQKTFFSNAMENLAMPLFTANLKKAEAGNYNFGFIDSTEFTGAISFIDVNTTAGFWQFESAGFTVGASANGTTASAMTPMPHQAIADTGTTLLMLPEAITAAYYRSVRTAQNSPEAGGYVFSCSETLPDLTLHIGQYNAVVPGELINFAPADNAGSVCFGGVQSAGQLPFAIYGDVLLKSQFVVFQGGAAGVPARLGFANKPL